MVDKYLRELIRTKLKYNSGSLRKAEAKYGLSDYNHRMLNNSYTRIDILIKLIDICKIPRHSAEKHISEWIPNSGNISKQFLVKFPLKINPLHFRMVAHIIGDGTISTRSGYKFFIWCQKGTENMEQLQKLLLGANFTKQKDDKITIPSTVVQFVSHSLGIPFKEFNKRVFLKSCLPLPREYQIQVLSAIIEDEGSLDKNRLIIRMSDRYIMENICYLIDRLNYDRTQLRMYVDKNKFSTTIMYRTDINIRGIKKLSNDLQIMKQKYGYLAGLWTKDKKLQHLSKSHTLLDAYKRHEEITPKIMAKFINNDMVLFSEVKKDYNLTDDQTTSILRFMKNKYLIKKIGRGRYIKNEVPKSD